MGTTQVILYERIAKLGNIGDVVSVKSGYARNFLLPFGKAIRNTKHNRSFFEAQKDSILAENLANKQDAQSLFDVINDKTYVMISQTSETGQLYGSVNTRDISKKIHDVDTATIQPQKIDIKKPFKSIGIYEVDVNLHADIIAKIKVNIARSVQEAKTQEDAGVIGSASSFYQNKQDEKEKNLSMSLTEKAEKQFENLQNSPSENDEDIPNSEPQSDDTSDETSH